MNVSGKTGLLGVIGHPIGHSLSPRMHNASFAALGMDYVYVAMDVRPEDLAAAVGGLKALGFRGFNVTMPHKVAILPLLDKVEDPARITGAVNTVVIEKGRLRGTNTDGGGFVEACNESQVSFAGTTVLLVGAGGAAAAIAAAVLDADARELRILNRSRWRAEKLCDTLNEARPESAVAVYAAGDAGAAASGADVIVNATYLGMKDKDPLPVPDFCLEPGVLVCDAVYRPGGETRLIRLARERGLRAVPGEGMLLFQGVQAQRIWTHREPDVEAMRRALARD